MRHTEMTVGWRELRSAALRAIRWGWPVVAGTFVGSDRRWHGRQGATGLCPIQEACASVIVLEDSIIGVQSALAAGTTVFAIPDLPQTRPLAHRSFPNLTDPTLWEALALALET